MTRRRLRAVGRHGITHAGTYLAIAALIVAIWSLRVAQDQWQAGGANLRVTAVSMRLHIEARPDAGASPSGWEGRAITTYVVTNVGRLQTTVEAAFRRDLEPGTRFADRACAHLPLTLQPGEAGLLVFAEPSVAPAQGQSPTSYVGELAVLTSDGTLRDLPLPDTAHSADGTLAQEMLAESIEGRVDGLVESCL